MTESDPKHTTGKAEARRDVTPVFTHKGVGSNKLLTAAAAVVPMVIVGVATLTSLAGRRGRKGGRR